MGDFGQMGAYFTISNNTVLEKKIQFSISSSQELRLQNLTLYPSNPPICWFQMKDTDIGHQAHQNYML